MGNYMKYFIYFVIAVVTVAIVAAFFVAGSPVEARLRKFDTQKINHLQTIQSEITYYWQSKQKLPDRLAELNDSLRNYSVPKDPQSGNDYEYLIKGPETFELCAVFNRTNETGNGSQVPLERAPVPAGGYSGPEYWQHGADRTCFERKIDKDFFPPTKERPIQ